jgi:hypothetical protein
VKIIHEITKVVQIVQEKQKKKIPIFLGKNNKIPPQKKKTRTSTILFYFKLFVA